MSALIDSFANLIITADANASRYEGPGEGNYTVWGEFGENPLFAADEHSESAVKIQIDRYTKIEDDPVADAIKEMLDNNSIAYEYLPGFEANTGYIRHMWICEVI